MSIVIEQIKGIDKRIYTLIGPLVMSLPVIRYNNNYPFKTSAKYLWFVAMEEPVVKGFIPVKVDDGDALIDNYYIRNDDTKVLIQLVQSILSRYGKEYKYTAVVHTRHKDMFLNLGFHVKLEWKKYVKMNILPVDKMIAVEAKESPENDEQTECI